MVLRTLLISKGQKNGDEKKNSSLTQAERSKKKEFSTTRKNSLV